jgi:2,4-dienoyl-CoA reductase-like NADH-dependent reductase (Old Yellow Enzyme family)
LPDPLLFQPIRFRSVESRNRIAVSPMCQYSADDGLGNDWHIQNLGAKAAGGPGIVFTEATHVSAEGRITHGCLGLWTVEHEAFLGRLAGLIARMGAVPGIQIAHAGRKGSTARPWEGSRSLGPDENPWPTLAPSAIPFYEDGQAPRAMSEDDIRAVIGQFAATAARARRAGFKIAEIHAAHGYLLHEFMSPIANQRDDGWGGDLRGRSRMLMEVLDAVRAEWPADLPLFVRLTGTDWLEGGITPDEAVQVAKWLKARGDVDLVDTTSGGIAPNSRPPKVYPGYQVPLSERIRREAGIATGAVGMIRTPEQAEEIVENGRADLVFVARAVLAEPSWPLRAAQALGVKPPLPVQYERAVV